MFAPSDPAEVALLFHELIMHGAQCPDGYVEPEDSN